MDMHSKREMRKNKKMNEDTKSLPSTSINWYPGHMVKAQNEIKANLKLIDIVLEILDARIPVSSGNPIIKNLAKDKQRIVILNKCDLADKNESIKWKNYFEKMGVSCILTNANIGENIKNIVNEINKKGNIIYSQKYKDKKVNINPIYRVLIVGIPNVGKSTIINKLANRQVANVGNKPGVTKNKQWIRISGNIELLDTPGLLWPKFDDESIGIKLALTGNIKQEILDMEEIAVNGIEILMKNETYREIFIKKYKLENENLDIIPYDILEIIGRKRGCLISGGNVDMEKAAKLFLEEFKNGKIGNFTLDCI